MGAACIKASSVNMDSTPFEYLAWTSGSEYIQYNSWASFWQTNCAVRYRSNSSSSAITDLWMGRVQKQRQTLAERLIHKVCSGRHANLARRVIVRVYETSPCTPLLFPLRKPPKSPRDDGLAERRIFLPSSPPVRSAGR